MSQVLQLIIQLTLKQLPSQKGRINLVFWILEGEVKGVLLRYRLQAEETTEERLDFAIVADLNRVQLKNKGESLLIEKHECALCDKFLNRCFELRIVKCIDGQCNY